MRIFPIWAVMFLVGVLPAHAQSDQAAADPVIPDRSYQLLRENEDWSFLHDSTLRKDVWDPIKYLPLRGDAQDWYLTIGGEVRQVWERVGNDNWGAQPYLNSFWHGVYAVPGFLLVPAGTSLARFVGYRPGVEARWEIDRHAYLQADYGVFYAGQFLKEAAPGRNLDYMALWAGYKF